MRTFNRFWMVWREHGTAPTAKHTEMEARKEAERLARAFPGQHFYVLRAERMVVMTDVEWRDATDDIPF